MVKRVPDRHELERNENNESAGQQEIGFPQ